MKKVGVQRLKIPDVEQKMQGASGSRKCILRKEHFSRAHSLTY
jgi:hypothetical protein